MKKTYHVPDFAGESAAGGSQEIIISLYSALARQHRNIVLDFEVPTTRKILTSCSESGQGSGALG